MSQREIDAKNAEFWNEVCGSSLARSLGITEISIRSLRRFDEAYLRLYPYLGQYVLREDIKDKRVLEIGLGYGTLGQVLVEHGSQYHGLDVAEGPVRMMSYRLFSLGKEWKGRVQVGSILNAPYGNCTFDYVYTIGCLHHVGSLDRSISEVYRILKKGGKAVVMLYNKNSLRLLVEVPTRRFFSLLLRRGFIDGSSEKIRALYDTDIKGAAAPHTDFVSPRRARQLFKRFSSVRIDIQNFDNYTFHGRMLFKRERFLGNIARILGLDLYITAIK
jgi:SAM-dependent methyltransferase